MTNKYPHIPQDDRLGDADEEFFSQVTPEFKRTKADVWDNLEALIGEEGETPKPKGKVVRMPWIKYAAAAVVVMMLSTVAFMMFYTAEVTCPRGQHITHVLPDGSSVELNADSKLSYAPYWWSFSRELNFEGEGFFSVQKGSDFTVISTMGTTQVLGTSFNINTRNNGYTVYCATGKVWVGHGDETVVLAPKMMAVLNTAGTFDLKNEIPRMEIVGWEENKFTFTAASVPLVIEELERQYDVTIMIDVPNADQLTYSGYFEKPDSGGVEDALEIICLPLGLEFKKEGPNAYRVVRKE